MANNTLHRVIPLTADWQPVGSEDAHNVDLIAASGNAGTAYIKADSGTEHFPLIAGQIQDYAKDGVSRVSLATIMVKGTVGDKLLLKGEC